MFSALKVSQPSSRSGLISDEITVEPSAAAGSGFFQGHFGACSVAQPAQQASAAASDTTAWRAVGCMERKGRGVGSIRGRPAAAAPGGAAASAR